MPTSYAHWKSLPELQEDFKIPVVIVPHNSSDSFLSRHKKVNEIDKLFKTQFEFWLRGN